MEKTELADYIDGFRINPVLVRDTKVKYQKGTFITVPNKEQLKGKPSEMQTVFMWLNNYSDETGSCFPSRARLAKESGCNIKTVDKYLQMLVDDGFITKETRGVTGSKQKLSNMYTILLLEDTPVLGSAEVQEMDTPSVEKGLSTYTNNGAVTQPIINSTNITKDTQVVITSGQLPASRGKTYITRVLSVYNDLFRNIYGVSPTFEVSRYSKQIKGLATTKSELQIAALLVTFFDWNGITGSDAFEWEKLVKATFPLGWFFSSVTSYEVYLRNVFGLEFDKEYKVREFVAKSLLELKK